MTRSRWPGSSVSNVGNTSTSYRVTWPGTTGDADAAVYGWKGSSGSPLAPYQVRLGSIARWSPSSRPDVNGVDVPFGATSEICTTHSVSVVVEVAYSVAPIGPASVVAVLNGAVV